MFGLRSVRTIYKKITQDVGAFRVPSSRFAYHTFPHRATNTAKPRHIPQANFFNNIFSGFRNDNNSPEDDEDEEEEGTFVPLDQNSTGSVDGTSESTFGPLAILAVGFLQHEFELFQNFLEDIGGDDIGLIPCTPDMLEGSLGEALLQYEAPPDHKPPVLGTRRVVFLSGMYASEVMEVVSGYKGDGLPDAVFAAAVPRSWEKNLGQLIQDVTEDHAKMAQRRAEAALDAARQSGGNGEGGENE